MQNRPKIASAQGQAVNITGFVTLDVNIVGSGVQSPVEFLVVDHLVVPVLLGTPWINEHVSAIHPISKTVDIRAHNGTDSVVEVPLQTDRASSSKVLKVTSPGYIPPMSEAWLV
jgi:hypothetical protein